MNNIKRFSSRKEVTEFLKEKGINTSNWSEEKWLSLNKGQAEIHMMALAEAMWDAMNESTPKELKAGEWHIPFGDKVFTEGSDMTWMTGVKISTAMCARTSYTVVGDEKEFALEQQIALHDRMANQVPFHASPFEHCAKAMTDEEYTSFIKGKVPQFKDDWGIGVHERYFVRTKKMFEEDLSNFTPYNKETTYLHGWCRNFKGFIQYREILENGNSSN